MPPRSLAELRRMPIPPWVWEGFIAPSNFTLLSAYPKVGKTTMLSRFIRNMMRGDSFLERATRPVPVLYFTEEAGQLHVGRADELGYSDEWPIMYQTPEPGLTWEMCIFWMKRWVYLYREPLIVIDTLSRFWSAGDENNATQVDHAIRPVLEVIRNSSASLLAIHHNRKQGGGGGIGVRGSTALTGGVDIIMELSRLNSYDHSAVRRLQCESRYGQTPNLMHIRLHEDDYIVEDDEMVELEPQIIAILQTMEGITLGDLQVLSGAAETTLRRALASLYQRGVVSRAGTGTSRSPYLYSLNAVLE